VGREVKGIGLSDKMAKRMQGPLVMAFVGIFEGVFGGRAIVRLPSVAVVWKR
jgi:hypothetical protein